jgi:hypothetical protein
MFKNNTLFLWQLAGGKPMAIHLAFVSEQQPIRRLLEALEKASRMEDPGAIIVGSVQYDLELDTSHPDYHIMPCYKQMNRREEKTYVLDKDRAQLWDILARHYLHAFEQE